MQTRLISLFASLLLGVAGCGGSSGGGGNNEPPPPPPVPITKAEAYQFLNQATFGATETEAQSVIDMRYEAWIDEQLQQPASEQLPFLLNLPDPQFMGQRQADRVDIWFRNVLQGRDQLRQRVALARTLMEDRPVVLMDEPFSGLDSIGRLRLQDLAAELLDRRTVLLVTHDPLEALRLGHQVHVLSGRPALLDRALQPDGPRPRDPGDPALLTLQGELIGRLQAATDGKR